ncbi:MAG: hypothetical protein Q8R02_08740 [Hyphomonadaceae bacterium]|nr:hypothetical protein [Hyphomonadaceae bacterium]
MIFTAPSTGAKVKMTERASPGGGDLLINISCDQRTADDVADAVGNARGREIYDDNPSAFELKALEQLKDASPALVRAINLAFSRNPAAIRVTGLPSRQPPPATPLDGVAAQDELQLPLRLLAGAARAASLVGFAYASENGGRIVRAVCPVQTEAETVSSHGAVDLGFHADNADLPVPDAFDLHPGDTKPMNAWQGFVTITPRARVPMRFMVLADAIAWMRMRRWDEHIDRLMQPEFNAAKPASHGIDAVLSNLPVLVPTRSGAMASRYHAVNITGMNRDATLALAAFGAAIEMCKAELLVPGRAGDLLFYQNPRCLHRRQAFKPAYDGQDRFYLRVYFDDVARVESAAAGRHRRVYL